MPTNTTGIAQPIVGVRAPESVQDVVALVHWARSNGARLYPVSRGLNWGYGSSSPPMANCVLVDLSRMDKIRNRDGISIANPVAVIEPGVTQAQLHEYLRLHVPGLGFNVTGSGRETSILGNALDRGVGYIGPRKEDIFGLEFVDGTGQVIKTGFRRLGDESPLANCHPYGVGPILDGLLSQSNFGIVTSACFKLISKRPKAVAVSLALRRPDCMGEFIDELVSLKRDNLLNSVTHVGNRSRTHATLLAGVSGYLERYCGLSGQVLRSEAHRALDIVSPTEWTGLSGVSGNTGQVRAALAEIHARIRTVARMNVVTQSRLDIGHSVTHRLRRFRWARANAAAISAIRPLHALALGVPTDVAIENLLWQYGRSDLRATQLDQSNCGLIFVNPALPADGAFVARFVGEIERLAATFGHILYMTVNVETSTSLVAVINLLFDRNNSDEVEVAHRCADALLDHVRRSGLEVYRARADMMGALTERDPAYWELVHRLKSVFDPDGLISPGRYGLSSQPR